MFRAPGPSLPRRARARRALALLPFSAVAAFSGFAVAAVPASAAGTGTVNGTLLLTPGNAPMTPGEVDIGGQAGLIDANGHYVVNDVPLGVQAAVYRTPCRTANNQVDVKAVTTNTWSFQDRPDFDGYGHVCRTENVNSSLDPVATTKLALTGDDAGEHVVLPFAFPFYGHAETALDVSTNGYVRFDGASNEYQNVAAGDPTAPSGSIFAFWDDLVVDQSSAVYTGVHAAPVGQRVFVVRWSNVRFSSDGTGARLTFELSLHEDGRIDVVYANVSPLPRARGASATMGIRSPSGTFDALSQSYDAQTVMNGLDVRYVKNAPPVAKAGSDRKVASGASFTLDASGSTDPDGNAGLWFWWRQIAGSTVPISDPFSAKPTLAGVKGPVTATFRVTVTDPYGREGTDDVVVTIAAPK